jgi:hypothetical protein
VHAQHNLPAMQLLGSSQQDRMRIEPQCDRMHTLRVYMPGGQAVWSSHLGRVDGMTNRITSITLHMVANSRPPAVGHSIKGR